MKLSQFEVKAQRRNLLFLLMFFSVVTTRNVCPAWEKRNSQKSCEKEPASVDRRIC